MKQIDRIQEMERCYDTSAEAVKTLSEVFLSMRKIKRHSKICTSITTVPIG